MSQSVDARLAKSLEKVAEFADAKKALLTDLTLSDEERATAVADLTINGSRLIDFCLDFTLPGYDIELKVCSAPTQRKVVAGCLSLTSCPFLAQSGGRQ